MFRFQCYGEPGVPGTGLVGSIRLVEWESGEPEVLPSVYQLFDFKIAAVIHPVPQVFRPESSI